MMKHPITVLMMLLFTGLLNAQDNNQTSDEQLQSQDIEWVDTQQQIAVNQTVTDQAIEQRFAKILAVSKRIQEVQVSVTEGVLVLSGWTQKPEDKQWVESAANRTEGVIAVVNNIEVRLAEQWDLNPAVNEALSLYDKFIRMIPKLTIALLVLVLTWVLAKIATSLAGRVLKRKISNVFVLSMSARLFAVPVVLVGIYLVLKLTGLTNLAMTVIGGTGLLGLVIGIAFKDIAENFLASILISIRRPFKTGDYIKVSGHEGVVQSVTTRGTVIMTLDGNHVHIPNAIIYKNTIVNVTANPNIRQQFSVGIGFDDSIIEAQQLALKVMQQHDAVLHEPEPQVLVESLGAATVNLVVYFWVNGQINSSSKVKSAIIRLVKRAYIDGNISMPDDAREVIFPEGIRIIKDQVESVKPVVVVKPNEPETNAVEADLSNDVDEIRKQSEENQLSEAKDNLLKDD